MSAKTNAKKKEQDKPQSSGLGLDGLGDHDSGGGRGGVGGEVSVELSPTC